MLYFNNWQVIFQKSINGIIYKKDKGILSKIKFNFVLILKHLLIAEVLFWLYEYPSKNKSLSWVTDIA